MQRLLMLSAALTIYAASAVADPLKGAFGFSGSDVCLYASGGFNANLQALGTTYSSSSSDAGIRIFNGSGNGTGTFTNRDTSVTVPPTVGFLPAAGPSESSARSTYTVSDDTFTSQTVPGTDTGTVLTGPRKGQTFKLEGVPAATGLISANGRTLVTSILTPGVETITYSNGDVEHRICHRSREYVKLDADGAQ
jgi:hypothetical protein